MTLITVTRIAPIDTLPLRGQVLRPGLPVSSSVFQGDDDPRAIHLACRIGERIAAIASLYPVDRPDLPGSWQLRGMATDPAERGRGLGQMLLGSILDEARAQRATAVWCNARVAAAGFYEKSGFETISEQFDIPGVGLHVVMRRFLGSGP